MPCRCCVLSGAATFQVCPSHSTWAPQIQKCKRWQQRNGPILHDVESKEGKQNWLTLVDMFYSCTENVQIPRCHLLYYISIWAPKAYSIWRNQSKLAAVLSPHCSLRSIRSLNLNLNEHSEGCCLGNCTFRKLPLVGCKFGKFHFTIKYHILDSADLIV